jgi:hypothetical protein
MTPLEARVPLFCPMFLHVIIPAACAQRFFSRFSSFELTKMNSHYSGGLCSLPIALICLKVMNKAAFVSE